jgi:adenylate cyclase
MTDTINDQGGTLDKFIGDAIVAFYGAPVFMKDHAYRACLTSQLMDKKLVEL